MLDHYRLSAIFQAAYDPYDWLISSQVIYAGGEPKADVADTVPAVPSLCD